jgi:glutamate-1-semialdehyde 2,1-aminomutase
MTSNAEMLKRAYQILPGNSLGTFYLPEGHEFVIERGAGSKVYDVEGREYLDYVLGSGPMLVGHAHPDVVAAVKTQVDQGSTFYGVNDEAIRLGEKIVAASPCAEAIKFCSSGSEATFYALRLARAATGRDAILKFEGGYHGHHDHVMFSVTPQRLAPFPEPVADSAGIPEESRHHVLVAPFNDLEQTVAIMRRHKDDLAAVLVEPLSRMLAPKPGFLEGLREATRELGMILIFDEVVTGFRVAWGGAQQLYGVIPDLACYGKVVGGGMPLAAVAGKRDVMELANPRKKGSPDYTYMSGTLNGNPVAATAGLATLAILERPGTYERLRAVGDRLRTGLTDITVRLAMPAQVLGTGPLANIYFSAEAVTDYRSSLKADSRIIQQLGRGLLERGIMTNLVAKLYISLVHSDADIDRTLGAVEDTLKAMRAR